MVEVSLVVRAPKDVLRKDPKNPTGPKKPGIAKGGFDAYCGSERRDSRKLHSLHLAGMNVGRFYGEGPRVKELLDRDTAVQGLAKATAEKLGLNLTDDVNFNLDYLLGKKVKGGGREASKEVVGTINVA